MKPKEYLYQREIETRGLQTIFDETLVKLVSFTNKLVTLFSDEDKIKNRVMDEEIIKDFAATRVNLEKIMWYFKEDTKKIDKEYELRLRELLETVEKIDGGQRVGV